ncbi:MAG: asparaginase [Gemmatimonadetes bacterium]|nr:asparaginase [Gemmatimonadota bacterium]
MIHLLFTGGTISMQRDARAGGNVPAHDGAALVALAPELPAVAPFTVEDWGRYPACHMGPDTLWALRSRVAAVQGGGAAQGIVVTHGTDTLEETAYLLGRTLDPAVPVVLTGAMRTSSEAGWDGPRNLTDAARVAADPASRGRGAMVVFAGKIFDGRTVAKVQATALDAFAAPHGAPIGVVAGAG